MRTGTIEGTRGPGDLRRARTGSATTGTFADLMEQAFATDAEPATAAAALLSVDALLGLQSFEEDSREHARRRALLKAEDLLDRLGKLQQELTAGTLTTNQLAELAQTVRSERVSGIDPQLANLLDEIELRASIELAKIECARTS